MKIMNFSQFFYALKSSICNEEYSNNYAKLVSSKIKQLQCSRVSIFSKNSIEQLILILSLLEAKKSVVIHNTRLTKANCLEQKKNSQTELAFSDGSYDLSDLGFKKIFDFHDSSFLFKPTQKKNEIKEPEIIIFTSGSTGVGKGVRLNIEKFLIHAEASNQVNMLEQGDCWLASLPFYHVGGLCIPFRCLKAGAFCYVIEKFSADAIFQALENNPEITHISLVPSVLKELLERKEAINLLKRLKLILVGGAPNENKVLEKIIELKLPVRTSYGMSETCSHISFLNQELNLNNYKSSGRVLNSVQVKLNQKNELLVKSDSLFLGYLGKGDTSEWFNTGDLAQIDQESGIEILGRTNRTFISGGENINPEEIEKLVLDYKEVQEAVVVAIEDEKWGRVPALLLEVKDINNFKIEALKAYLDQSLARYKKPKLIKLVEKIPKTNSGKINFSKAKTLF